MRRPSSRLGMNEAIHVVECSECRNDGGNRLQDVGRVTLRVTANGPKIGGIFVFAVAFSRKSSRALRY